MRDHALLCAMSEDKKCVRLNVISHMLEQAPYQAPPATKVQVPEREISRYEAADHPFRYVPECV